MKANGRPVMERVHVTVQIRRKACRRGLSGQRGSHWGRSAGRFQGYWLTYPLTHRPPHLVELKQHS